MTEQQDVRSHQRQSRRGNTILLGLIPVAVALTALVTSGAWASAPQSPLRAHAPATETFAPVSVPSVIAPSTVVAVDNASVPAVKVVLPEVPAAAPQPAVAPAAKPAVASAKAPTSKATTAKTATPKQVTAKKSTPKKKSINFAAYCGNPKAPYAASGGPKALLSAANKERARLGIKKMTWSSSLATAATKWSKSLAAADSKTKAHADKLAHNPNRPGAENVAVSYVSNGLSQGGAISRAHKNWMYSAGHCKNIMNPAYSTMGAGGAPTTDGTTWYTTENFR